jgi:membrane associated rhomboid family serine protease
MSTQTETTCYRHPGRETRVSCSSCGRPICPDCMRPSPVGMRCPECSSQTKVVNLANVGGGEPRATIALIVICAIVFLAEGSYGLNGGTGSLFRDGALFGPSVADGDWWRLVTYGFLHAGWLHIGFNMLLLWLFGREMEPQLGTPTFLGIYFSSLLAGAFGALVLSPDVPTVGASGAIFGLMGAAAAILYARGVNPFQTDIGMLIIFNLVLSFVLSNVSVGGHIGGLVGGVIGGLAVASGERSRRKWIGWAGLAGVAIVSVIGAEIAARSGGAGLGI